MRSPAFTLFCAALSPALALAQGPPPASDDPFRQIEILAHAMEIIRQDFVDPDKLEYESLTAAALDGMLKNLDPHSGFIPKSAYEEMRRGQSGTYQGVGVTIALSEGALSIISVREDGPAAAAGILPGDELVQIGASNAVKLSLDQAVGLLKANPAEPLSLTLRRPASGTFFKVDLARAVLRQSSVKDALILPESLAGNRGTGYVRLLQFTQNTPGELSQALDDLASEGMRSLILDLRNNPGGLLSSAVAVCGEFLPPGTVVLTIEGRRPSQNPPPYRTPVRAKNSRDLPLVILVNHASASGAEVVAGALQDLKRAVVIGETTFGKGSVQSLVDIPGGGAMRLTTARFFTPARNVIHGRGIVPHITSTLTPDQELRVARWRAADSPKDKRLADLAELGDHQLARAADTLRGVLTYQELLGPDPSPAEPAPPSGPAPTPR